VSKPVVDRLQKDLEGQAAVLRLDITSDVGREAARDYDVTVVPTMLVFDGAGVLILHQNGIPDEEMIREAVATASK
jgi:hypothetical protein